MQKRRSIFVLAVGLALSGVAWAQQGSDLVVLAPPESPPLSASAVHIDSMPDLTPYLGKPVVATEVVVEDSPFGTITPKPIRAAKEGDTMTPALARAVLQEVLDSGLFGDAWVNVVEEGAGVRIRVHGRPRKLVLSVRLDTHAGTVPAEDVLREAQIDDGSELVGNDLDVRTERIRALLARRGFPAAVVKGESRETDQASRILVLIDVNEGAPRKVGRRVFYPFGATADDLRAYTDRYGVDTGDRADETALDVADQDLEKALHDAGYHDADVLHDVVLSKNIVTVRVRIDSGPRYTIRFVGNDHYDDDTLKAAVLAEGTETDLSPAHLESRLEHFYEIRGFLDADATTEMRGQPGENVRALVFHINERSRVRVASRSYPCLKEDEIKKLHGGGPTSAAAVGREIDSFLEEDLPGADLFVGPPPRTADAIFTQTSGTRREPIDLDPDQVYSPATYERAVAHVQELYRNEGYLSATVGPVQVVRRACDAKSPAGRCIPVPLPAEAPLVCAYDTTGLPVASPPLPPELTCTPDPAHGVSCEPAVSLRIPIKLGPRTFMYDIAFRGASSIDEKRLQGAALVALGEAVNGVQLDEARRRILDLYREEGFAYADVSFAIEKSSDQTRARIRFDVNEGDRVIVREIVIRGNNLTRESVIRRRIALFVGQPYRASDVRKTQERIATLNVFSSVNVSLANPLVPQKNKKVVITVVEVPTQYVEIRPGISSGEGVRGAFEYGYRNLFGYAIGASVRAQLSYLPDLFIQDPTIQQNFDSLSLGERLAARATASLAFPDVGLGPLVRATFDAVILQDPERYFTILKEAVIPTFYFRPVRQVQFSLGVSGEHNFLHLFNGVSSISDALVQSGGNLDVAKLLRAPEGSSFVVAQRLTFAWDRRDSAFNAHKGTYLAGSIEHDQSFTECVAAARPNVAPPPPGMISVQPAAPFSPCVPPDGHFMRLAQTISAYYPLTQKIALAFTLRLGEILQFYPASVTYPDRFFFMGGIDSMRGWSQDTMYPQDAVDAINASHAPGQTPIDPGQIAVRGGNLRINPRAELRLPLFGPLETVVFFDCGNLWQDATYAFSHPFAMRAAAGSGVRVQTPVGPLALDYGINLTRYGSAYAIINEDFGALNFSIGLF